MDEQKKISDILLVEEESTGPNITVKCDECGDVGFKIGQDRAIQCPACLDARVKAIRRSRLSNIPVSLRRFPIKFDVNVTMSVLGKDLEVVKEISGNKNVEDRLNGKIFELLSNGSSFFVFGNPGSGKTMVACGIAVKYIDDGKSASYVMSSEIFDMGFSQVENFQQQKSLFNSDVLIIDDLGSEFVDSKNFKVSFFHKVLASRAVKRKPTIITSNHNPKNLQKHYGQKVARQITDNFICFRLDAENFNKKMTDDAAQFLIGD